MQMRMRTNKNLGKKSVRCVTFITLSSQISISINIFQIPNNEYNWKTMETFYNWNRKAYLKWLANIQSNFVILITNTFESSKDIRCLAFCISFKFTYNSFVYCSQHKQHSNWIVQLWNELKCEKKKRISSSETIRDNFSIWDNFSSIHLSQNLFLTHLSNMNVEYFTYLSDTIVHACVR